MTSQILKDFNFLHDVAKTVAPRLLGCILEREIAGQIARVKIVETEAYDQTDVASHSYKGEAKRSAVMFGEPGHLYVYFTYGMHYCCNIVVGNTGYGAAVLIRAVEPLDAQSQSLLSRARPGRKDVDLTNGPAKLCQALGIDKKLNGHCLADTPLQLIARPALSQRAISQTTRIGISKGQELPWRFYITGNRYISQP